MWLKQRLLNLGNASSTSPETIRALYERLGGEEKELARIVKGVQTVERPLELQAQALADARVRARTPPNPADFAVAPPIDGGPPIDASPLHEDERSGAAKWIVLGGFAGFFAALSYGIFRAMLAGSSLRGATNRSGPDIS